MKCPKCGKEIANDSNFCEFCGERIINPVLGSSKSNAKLKVFGICTGLLLFVIGLLIWKHSYSSNSSSKEFQVLTYVDSVEWESPIGKAIYSGYVIQVPSLGKVPHSKGIVRITEGEFAGCIYDGELDMGKMTGRAKYTLENGDVFVGEFKDGQYDKGKYVVASSGDSFEGTFKNGKPDKGNWYDKKGNKY